jgi:hypothetical protein
MNNHPKRFFGHAFRLVCAAVILNLSFAVAAIAQDDGDDPSMSLLQGMSDTLGNADSARFLAGTFFDEALPNGATIKRYAVYDVVVRHPDRLAFDVTFDDGSVRNGVFDGEHLIIAVPANRSYIRLEAAGTVDQLLHRMQDEFDIAMPLADILYSDIMDAHASDIMHAVHHGERKYDDRTFDHITVEGAMASWQVWLDQSMAGLPARFVARYIRSTGQPEFMATFFEWTLNGAVDEDFAIEIPDDWVELVAATED